MSYMLISVKIHQLDIIIVAMDQPLENLINIVILVKLSWDSNCKKKDSFIQIMTLNYFYALYI